MQDRFTRRATGALRSLVVVLIVGGMFASCGATAEPSAPDAPLRIVTTTNILGDVVANLTGDRATVTTLVPVGVDPHEYQASSQQIAGLREADLVVANGLGLEEGLSDVLAAAAADGVKVIPIGPEVSPQPFDTTEIGQESPSGGFDPHVWMDPTRMQTAVAFIETTLSEIDPTVDWSEGADAYAAMLGDVDDEIATLFDGLATRSLVTNHDSLRYFANRYELDIVGVVVPGGSTLAEPSSAQIAELIAVMREAETTVVFAETTEPTALAETIASELGPRAQVVELFTGSLGEPGSGAETLVDMLLTDARLIVSALGESGES